MDNETVIARLRTFLLALAGFTFFATIIELLLENHTKEVLQYVPFVLCLIGFVAIAAALLSPGRGSVFRLRIAMVIVGLGGIIGMGIHMFENFTFEQDIRPNEAFLDTLLPTLKGAAPLLAPGVLVFAAIVALAATYYHPALAKATVS
ncbi:MAG: hypothetical protein ABI690_33660 [Chloroflexota bacterium]